MGGVGDEQELLHELDNLGVREHEGEHLQEQRHWIRPRIDEEEAAPSVQRPHFAILVVVRDDFVARNHGDAKLEPELRAAHADHRRARDHRHRVITSRKENDDLPAFRAHPTHERVNRVGVLRHQATVERESEIKQRRSRQKSPRERVRDERNTLSQQRTFFKM